MVHGVSDVQGKERKRELARNCSINCPLCPYHRKENAGGHRVPRPDKHKRIVRETIRKLEVET